MTDAQINPDIQAKLDFLLEAEKLKAVLRKTRPHGLERYENSAEHSWQTTLAALLFMPEGVDALKVMKMMLIHDLVEIDAGDVFVYDDQGRKDVEVIEAKAADRLFGMLPDPIGRELHELWVEFEARTTPESIYAKAMDRVCPVLQNLSAETSSWNEHAISRERVLAKNAEIENASSELWDALRSGIVSASFPEDDES